MDFLQQKRLVLAFLLLLFAAGIVAGGISLRNALTQHPVKPISVYLKGLGSQTPLLTIPAQHQYAGGSLGISAEGGPSTITRVIVTQIGSVKPQDLANVHLHYDVSSSYCADQSFSEPDPTFGFPTTFDSSGRVLFTGSVPLQASQAACFYVVLDVKSTALNGQTLDLAIVNAETEIVASGDTEICPDVHNPPPTGPLVDTCPQRAIPGLTTLSLPPPSVTTVAGIGTQTPFINIPSTAQYVGGAFRMLPDSGGTTVNRIIMSEKGTVRADTNLFGAHLHYDLDSTAPYDCASESFSEQDPVYGVTTTFNSSGKATFDGSLEMNAEKAACFYVVLDVQSGAKHNETLEIEISNPSTEVVVGAGVTSPSVAVPIIGTTLLTQATPVSVTANALGTQSSTFFIPSSDNYIGGAFRLIPDAGSTTVTRIDIAEAGTVNETNITNLKLYYDLDTTSPYDCASESFSFSDALFSASAVATSDPTKVAFTGSVTSSTTQAACFYFIFDIKSGAQDGATLEIEIKNPSTDIAVGEGARVPSTIAVPLNGTSVLRRTEGVRVLIGARGNQVSLLNIPSTRQYLGGAFVASLTTEGTTDITKITLAERGTVAGSNITEALLYYDVDVIPPYDCASETFSFSDPLYARGVAAGSEQATFTGTVAVSSAQAVCFYVVVDIEGAARDGETLDIQIPNPSEDVVASGGAAVTPSAPVDISGVTVLSATATGPEVFDGDLIRAAGDFRVYIVKITPTKKFIRHIVNPNIFKFYPHLGFSVVKEVPTLAGFRPSAWVRLPLTQDPVTWRIYEVNDDASKHWITCANPDFCGPTWIAHGGDPDGIYTINSTEMSYYVTGPNVFLQ